MLHNRQQLRYNKPAIITTAAAVEAQTEATRRTPGSKQPAFPFVKIAGQEDMKLALMLNVVDPNIGGVLIMGDRGTAKSVIVREGGGGFVVAAICTCIAYSLLHILSHTYSLSHTLTPPKIYTGSCPG